MTDKTLIKCKSSAANGIFIEYNFKLQYNIHIRMISNELFLFVYFPHYFHIHLVSSMVPSAKLVYIKSSWTGLKFYLQCGMYTKTTLQLYKFAWFMIDTISYKLKFNPTYKCLHINKPMFSNNLIHNHMTLYDILKQNNHILCCSSISLCSTLSLTWSLLGLQKKNTHKPLYNFFFQDTAFGV